MTKPINKDWEEEFDKRFHFENGKWIYRFFGVGNSANGFAQPENFKHFISTLLKQQKQGLKERLREKKLTIDLSNDLWGYTNRTKGVFVKWNDILKL